MFLLLGSGEVQPWDNMEQYNLRKKEKEKLGLPMDEQISIKQAKMVEEGKPSNESKYY